MHTCHVHACLPLVMPHTFVQTCLKDTYIPHPRISALAVAACHWSTSFPIFTYATTNACIPWLMLHVFGRYLQIDECRLKTMQEGHIECQQTKFCML